MQFLDKLPRTLATITHTLNKLVETETDDEALWVNVFDEVLDYLINCGLYDASRRQSNQPSSRIFNVTTQSQRINHKSNVTCYGCGEKGYNKSSFPKTRNQYRDRERRRNASRTKISSANQPFAWMCRAMQSQNPNNTFIIDSGASHHVCGRRNLFTSIQQNDEKTLMTANGNITCNEIETVSITLEKKLQVELQNALHWEKAPSLISVSKSLDKNLRVSFQKNSFQIVQN